MPSVLTPTGAFAAAVDTAGEVRPYLRVEHAADDSLLDLLVEGVSERAVRVTGRALVSRAYTYTVAASDAADSAAGIVDLPLSPVVSVASVTHTDAEGTATVLTVGPEEDYTLAGGRVRLSGYGVAPGERLVVAFTAGYATAAGVPAGYRLALLEAVAWAYHHRGEEEPDDAFARRFFPYTRLFP